MKYIRKLKGQYKRKFRKNTLAVIRSNENPCLQVKIEAGKNIAIQDDSDISDLVLNLFNDEDFEILKRKIA